MVTIVLVLALWWVREWGRWAEAAARHQLGVGAAPFTGRWRLATPSMLVVPVIVAVAALAVMPGWLGRRRWSIVVLSAASGWMAWAGALGLVNGRRLLSANLRSHYDVLHAVPEVGTPGRFLSHFVADIGRYPTHVRGHPPGMVLVLWTMNRAHLQGTGWELALCLAGGAATVAGALVAVRSLAGEDWARRAAPFVAFAPAAVVGTNLDLVYAAPAALAVALAALATETPAPVVEDARRLRSWMFAAGSGVALALAALFSYGLAPMALVVAAVCISRRRWSALCVIGITAAVVISAPAAWGFWWVDGLRATQHQYWQGLASQRPARYFAVADVVAAAAMVGPVGIVAVGRLFRSRGASGLRWVIAAVAAVVAAALASQLSKGEVERIWQPFFPWFALAAGVFVVRDRARLPARMWLGAQLLVGLVLVGSLRSPW
jgi:hypothetical protein